MYGARALIDYGISGRVDLGTVLNEDELRLESAPSES